MHAAAKGRKECVQELLEAGASTELLSLQGRTAMELAKAKGHAATAKLFRQHPALSKAPVTAEARAAAEAAAERVAEELLAEVTRQDLMDGVLVIR